MEDNFVSVEDAHLLFKEFVLKEIILIKTIPTSESVIKIILHISISLVFSL